MYLFAKISALSKIVASLRFIFIVHVDKDSMFQDRAASKLLQSKTKKLVPETRTRANENCNKIKFDFGIYSKEKD